MLPTLTLGAAVAAGAGLATAAASDTLGGVAAIIGATAGLVSAVGALILAMRKKEASAAEILAALDELEQRRNGEHE